jgi:subtilisin family serine protease
MYKRLLAIPCLCIVATAGAASLPSLQECLQDGPAPVWVYFTDKGAAATAVWAEETATDRISRRALDRRGRCGAEGAAVLWIDRPNDPGYLGWLRDQGLEIRAESRWLAAVSVVAGRDQLPILASAPFVERLELVRGRGERPGPGQAPAPLRAGTSDRDPYDYGGSLEGLLQINVPAVHALGYDGSGVVIGLLDTGFSTAHEALDHLDVLGTWDFVDDDPVVHNEPGDVFNQEYHGTEVLSAIGGYSPGNLVGPAFAASYYLAKTEEVGAEYPAEEDYWVAGMEWLEAQGCDVVTSSLGFDDYFYEQYDGDTCPSTIAADLAADLGVAVFQATGNSGPDPRSILAPADGHGVMAVGSVGLDGQVSFYSSRGPTADGRIKPDLCALGAGTWCVEGGTIDQYGGGWGTSVASPLAAGVAALLKQAHPTLGPVALCDALRQTASQASAPDNDMGWGIIDALAALASIDVTEAPAGEVAAAAPRLLGNWPNPFNPRTSIAFALARGVDVDLAAYDLRGQRLRTLMAGRVPAGRHAVVWDGCDDGGRALPAGVYLVRFVAAGEVSARKISMVR